MHPCTDYSSDPVSDFTDDNQLTFPAFDGLCMQEIESTTYAMNTVVSYRVIGVNAQEAVDLVLAEIDRLENLFSRFRPGSDIHRLNHADAGRPVPISPETAAVLSRGIHLNKLTEGNFNLLVGSLVDLWDFKHAAVAPAESRLNACLETLHAGQPVVDPDNRGSLIRPGQTIDLGGIAKGYAADRCLEILKQHGIRSAFINFGGNVAVIGCRPDGAPWHVGIRHPRSMDRLLGSVAVVDESVVTSGDYERYFIDPSGRRYHHLLNPVSGYPARSGLTSATIIASDGMVADALSTAIFVAGLDKATQYLQSFPGAEAILVDEDLRVNITPGLVSRFTAQEEIQIEVL